MKDSIGEENKEEVKLDKITELKTSNVSLSYFLYRLIAYADARRSIASFVFIFSIVVISDIILTTICLFHILK